MRNSSVFVTVVLAASIPFFAMAHAQQGATPAGSAPGFVPSAPPIQSSASGQGATAHGAQAPMGGRQFGEHVSGMAPEHPQMHGDLFGECVSEMAITGTCPHHEDE